MSDSSVDSLVSVVMGSKSDLGLMQAGIDRLAALGIPQILCLHTEVLLEWQIMPPNCRLEVSWPL